jgi:soluble lytic murein transglycosylase-like protein
LTALKRVRMIGVIAWGLSAALPAAFLVAPSPARADIYSYRDELGVVHYSNTPVDPRFVLYREEPKPAAAPAAAVALPNLSLPRESRWDDQIFSCSSTHEVDPAFVKAVMRAESDFDPQAVSRKGAMGLMQLMPETAERLGVQNPWDPQDNINGGVKYLGSLLRQFGSPTLAAAAYNAGEGSVERYGGIPPYDETQNYVKIVLRYYEYYRNAGYAQSAAAGRALASAAPSRPKIWQVRRDDGVVVFTNVPWTYGQNKVR